MATVEDVARAFAAGKSAKCGNANTNGTTYYLHGNAIASKDAKGVRYSWCGYYGPTTTNHLNEISRAINSNFSFSYRMFRDFGPGSGYFSELPPSTATEEMFKAHFELHRK